MATVIEMNHRFLLKNKSLDRSTVEDLNSYDIVAYLNDAQTIIIDELISNKVYSHLRPITESLGVDEGVDYVNSWDSTYLHGLTSTGDDSNSIVKVVKLDDLVVTSNTSYRNYLGSESKVTRSEAPEITDELFVTNVPITREEAGLFESTTSNRPIFVNPRALIEGEYLILLGDYYTDIKEAIVTVVRTPKILDLTDNTGAYTTTSELPVQLHDRIVDKAVQLYGETVNINDLKKQ